MNPNRSLNIKYYMNGVLKRTVADANPTAPMIVDFAINGNGKKIFDVKIANPSYTADVVQQTDYYPYGMVMPNRNGSDNSYRYGFQGQEKDDEVKGAGESINYKYRMHDPRIGRFFALDPLARKYPHYTPYSFSGNKLIHAVELEGLEEGILFPSTYGYGQIEGENKLKTDNWQVFDSHSWGSMKSSIKTFKAENPNQQIKYVYIQVHGNPMGIVVGPFQGQSNFVLTDTYGVPVSPWDLKEYKAYKSKGADGYKRFNRGATFNQGSGDNIKKRTYENWADNEGVYLDEMFELFNELPDGTTVILGACNPGESEDFLKGLYELSGRRLNFVANRLSTVPTGDNPLDNKLSNCGVTEGWVQLRVNTGGEIQNVTGTEQEGFIQLRSTGSSPMIYTEEACP